MKYENFYAFSANCWVLFFVGFWMVLNSRERCLVLQMFYASVVIFHMRS